MYRLLAVLLLLTASALAQSSTANIGLALPAHGQLLWDSPLNNDFVLIDCYIGGQCVAPLSQTLQLIINGGAPLTTSSQTGNGSLVMQSGPTINNPLLNGATLQGPTQVNGPFILTTILDPGTLSNTDLRGTLTCSAGSATYTFQGSYSNPPMCFPLDQTTHAVPSWSVSSTTLTISTCATDVIQYQCMAGQKQIITPTTTLALETGDNTAACLAANNPNYCTAGFTGLNTAAGNTTAQTPIVAPVPGHVSNVNVHTLLYNGWNGKFIAHYMPWFSTTAPSYNGHKFIGYSENSTATVSAQIDDMINRGFDVVDVDWYGTSTAQAFNQTSTLNVASNVANRSGFPIKFMITLDKGALSSGTATVAGCPQGATDQTTCLSNVGNALFDYIFNNWSQQAWYVTDAASGQAIVATFIDESAWSGTTWTTVLTNWSNHIAAYSHPFKLIKEFGNFTEAGYNGAYGWPQPPNWSNSNQFCWDSVTCSTAYLDTFYTAALANPSKVAIGAIWKGFDDNNASWGTNRVIAQQCGQVVLFGAARVAANGYSTSTQLPFMQVSTWNDYEEGLEVETGIDNCYRPTIALSTNTITATLNPTDNTYASQTTIHHWTIWYGDTLGNLYLAQDNVSTSAMLAGVNISTLVPTGTWRVYAEMVGQPFMLNRMSNVVNYSH